MHFTRLLTNFFIFLIFILPNTHVYSSSKKKLGFEELQTWNRINNSKISNNGQYVVYEIDKLIGDPRVHVYDGNKSEDIKVIPLASSPELSPESNYVAFKMVQPFDTIRNCKIEDVPAKKMPKNSMGIWVFGSDSIITFPKLKNYKMPEDEGYWLAILLEKDALEKKEKESEETEVELEKEEGEEEKGEGKKEKEEKECELKPQGDLLVLMNSQNADTITFKSVSEYTISDKGGKIAFVTSYKDSLERSDVVLFSMNNGEVDSIFHFDGIVKKLTFNENGSQLAFMASSDTLKNKTFSLYYKQLGKDVEVLVDSLTSGMPNGWVPSEFSYLSFSKTGKRLFFGTSPKPENIENDSIPDDEIPTLDIWSWTDLRLQPQQLNKLKSDEKKNYRAVWLFDENKFVQLADTVFSNCRLTRHKDSKYALLTNDMPYLRASNWTGRWSDDLKIVNINTGKTKSVINDQRSIWLSPKGNYVVWHDTKDTCFYAYFTHTGKISNLTKNIGVNFYDELDDHPMIPYPYGIAGWTKNDSYILLYDRYDIWKVDPEGVDNAVNLTNGFGRKNNVRLKIVKLDKDELFISIEDNILLKGQNEKTNEEALYWYNPEKDDDPKIAVKGDFHIRNPKKAKEEDRFLWSRETFNDYPDLEISSHNFKKSQEISNANPQQKDFFWGAVEQVNWKSFTGENLNGLLYKPEDFDPDKKYPMIVYFYERNFHTQHYYFTPSTSRSIINRTFYVSNEYLVFVPDITYRDGYPGKSAYDAVVSGVHSLIEKNEWVDAKSIALQGQSWGGYQTAWLITQTDMFAAAMAGAPVSNMTSAYGGIRWGSGLNRMFQYEKTQSRIGGTLWEKPMHYIENSPLFYAPNVKTPLLMMHNDNDGAVPWYQGIEFFVALRRLDKPVWLLNYNGEPHNLKGDSYANRLDLSMRMKQFFDHYLKGDPAPKWLLKGVSALEKRKNLGY